MRRLILAVILILCAFSAFADDECRVCEVAADPESGIATAACNLPDPDSWGSRECSVTYVQTARGVVLRCSQGSLDCYYIEVGG